MKTAFRTILNNSFYSWLLIAIVTFFLFSHTVHYGILHNYDDDSYFNDQSIKELTLSNIHQYFSEFYLGMYQPVPVLSFAVINHLFPDSIEAQRITNIFLHCINTLLVLIMVNFFTKRKEISFLTALFFAISPMHVESVTWLSTRGNLVYSLFYLAAIVFFIEWREKKSGYWFALFLLSFLFSLFSKVTAATLPMVIYTVDILICNRKPLKSLQIFVPLMLVSAIFIYVGVNASGSFGHIRELSVNYNLVNRIFLILHALWLYFVKAILPVSQSVIYLYPTLDRGWLPLEYYLTGLVILGILITIGRYGWKYRNSENGKIILTGMLFFLITVSIVLPLKWSRTILIAERYTYLPYIGLFLMAFFTAGIFFERLKSNQKVLIYIILAAFMIGFAVKTYYRNTVWESPVTLFGDVIEKRRATPEMAMGYFNRGNEYLRLNEYEKAIRDYTHALKLDAGYVEAYYNRGLANIFTGKFGEAVEDLTSCLNLKPANTEALLNRGIAYRSLGEANRALADFCGVINISPSGLAYFNRGALYYFNLHDTLNACSDWIKARELGFTASQEVIEKYCR